MGTLLSSSLDFQPHEETTGVSLLLDRKLAGVAVRRVGAGGWRLTIDPLNFASLSDLRVFAVNSL